MMLSSMGVCGSPGRSPCIGVVRPDIGVRISPPRIPRSK